MFEDGDILDADVIVFATGFQNDLNPEFVRLFGHDIAAQLEDMEGVDAEGEIKGLYKPTSRKSRSLLNRSSHANRQKIQRCGSQEELWGNQGSSLASLHCRSRRGCWGLRSRYIPVLHRYGNRARSLLSELRKVLGMMPHPSSGFPPTYLSGPRSPTNAIYWLARQHNNASSQLILGASVSRLRAWTHMFEP